MAEGQKSKTTSSATEQPPSADLVALTVDAATGRIINVEGVDAVGVRHAFSEVERARFVDGSKATLERVVVQPLEAGIDCILGAESDGEEGAEVGRRRRVEPRAAAVDSSNIARLSACWDVTS